MTYVNNIISLHGVQRAPYSMNDFDNNENGEDFVPILEIWKAINLIRGKISFNGKGDLSWGSIRDKRWNILICILHVSKNEDFQKEGILLYIVSNWLLTSLDLVNLPTIRNLKERDDLSTFAQTQNLTNDLTIVDILRGNIFEIGSSWKAR